MQIKCGFYLIKYIYIYTWLGLRLYILYEPMYANVLICLVIKTFPSIWFYTWVNQLVKEPRLRSEKAETVLSAWETRHAFVSASEKYGRRDMGLTGWSLTWKVFHGVCVCVQSLQSCLTLCDPMDCSPPGSSVHVLLQARILEQVAMLSSGGSSLLRDWTQVFCISYTSRQVLYP